MAKNKVLNKPERNRLIKQYRLEGKTYQHIGDIFGLSRQRILQILEGK